MKHDNKHIVFLDHFRGVAILFVFCFHALGATFWPLGFADHLYWAGQWRDLNAPRSFIALFPMSLGWTGVSIFFAISGFCIHLSHEGSRQKSFKVFFLRRFFRIYPPYFLVLILLELYYIITSYFGFRVGNSGEGGYTPVVGQVVSHIFLVHNFSQTYFYGVNGVFWSIAVEVQLYLLYPLLLWFAAHLGWNRMLWITGFIELSMRSVLGSGALAHPSFYFPRWYEDSPLIYWFSWTMGATLAEAYLKGKRLPFSNTPFYVCIFLVVGCNFFKPLFPFCFTFSALATTCLISDLLSRPAIDSPANGLWGLMSNHLRWAGIVSYSAYLIHEPILLKVPKIVSVISHGHIFPAVVMYGFCLFSWFLVFILSYFFYNYIERPSIALGKWFIQRYQQTELS